ncbi:hypothetical protein LSTR_LSTR010699 [Laodelphax striatellus]|uniref:Thioredoxin domain-containing protein 17 n=1 Tax=Laodelphax striatellus TaxID=195883 RepID=A0A482WSY1_LAOST|nr:hypothetical protein LSTR_LSTR010699 [Laodelphax striatellus]
MVKRYNVDGIEEFNSKIKELEALNETLFVMFSGSPNEEGHSWCPACQIAEPIVDEVLEKYKDNDSVHFLFVRVGDRPL